MDAAGSEGRSWGTWVEVTALVQSRRGEKG